MNKEVLVSYGVPLGWENHQMVFATAAIKRKKAFRFYGRLLNK